MKRIVAILLCFILLLTTVSCGKGQEAPTEAPADDKQATFTQQCESAMKSTLVQGTAYAVVNGEEILSLSNGKADKKADADNSADAVYQFASITKQFTAAAIMRLYEDGKLDLQDTIDKFFPSYPAGKSITIHMLLCMRAGLPDYINNETDTVMIYDDSDIPYEIGKDKTAAQNRAAIEDWLFSQELLFTPDTQFAYSNSAYLLLGEIIEQVSGTTYQEYLTATFLLPLGMSSAGFYDAYDNKDVTVAKAYSRGEDADWLEYPGARFGCGDLLCSPQDLAKWGAALLDGKVVSADSWKKMTTPYSTDAEGESGGYGYGLAISETEEGVKVISHTGHFPSYFSMLLLLPDYHYAGITVSNHSDSTAVGLCTKIAKLYYNDPF